MIPTAKIPAGWCGLLKFPMYNFLQINLTAPKETLIKRIADRVKNRGLNESFERAEINIMKKQLVWFEKYSQGLWFDVSTNNWQDEAKNAVRQWYNEPQDAS